MKATPANMKMLCANKGAPIAVPGVFAYCPTCGDRCSATPGDYFNAPENEPLMCGGNSVETIHKPRAMVLAREAIPRVREVKS